MRKGYFNELQVYKSINREKLRKENAINTTSDNAIHVTLFDPLSGLD
jgi:hypothetical protein